VITERLYYTDPYLIEFEAQALEVAPDGLQVYLDRTAFYPTSGGQPFDLGLLAGCELVEVIDEGERILHRTSVPVAPGPMRGQINWPRRYDHMQQHTGQHLLSAVMVELYGFETLSFHMGDEVSTIELAIKELSENQIDKAEERANALARNGLPVRISFEDAAKVEGLRKQSQRSGTLRIIEIEGVDKSACGGTHVRSLAETLPIQIRKLEKVRGNVRLEFVCGWRATRRAKHDFRIAQELARQSAMPIDKLAEHFAAQKQRFNEIEKEKQRLADSLAQREGQDLYAATEPSPDGLRRNRWDVDQITEAIRSKALAYAKGTKSVVLVVSKQPTGLLIACSADAGLNAGEVLKKIVSELGGRGGGAATLAQGAVPAEAYDRLSVGQPLLEWFGRC
jgi:alanyl-tRNA synthetase